jgi:hypothetical protein
VRFLVNVARRAASNCTPTLGSYGAREMLHRDLLLPTTFTLI